MKKVSKTKDIIPDSFPSYEAAGDFWDKHDSSDFTADMTPVQAVAHLERRHFEIEVDEEVARALEKKARARKLNTGELANELLRQDLQLVPA